MGHTKQTAKCKSKESEHTRSFSDSINGVEEKTNNFLLGLCNKGKKFKKVYKKYNRKKGKDGFDSKKWIDKLYRKGVIKEGDYKYYSTSSEVKPTVYKFRAECDDDARKFGKEVGVDINIKCTVLEDKDGRTVKYYDVTGTFLSEKSHAELLKIAWSIEDCHVLAGTLQPENLYTGECCYDSWLQEIDDHEPVHSGPELPNLNEEKSMNEQEDFSISKLSPTEKRRIRFVLNKMIDYLDLTIDQENEEIVF